MKKILMSLLLLNIAVFGMTGENVYKTKCASCHAIKGMMSQEEMSMMEKKMQTATKQEKMAMQKKMKEKMEKSGMLAPAMPMVSMRLKKMTKTRDAFIVFVKDYIQNPNQDKGYCMPMAYKRFGTMPAIGKGMTEEERTLIANWLYDNFKGKWGASMDTQACESRNDNKKNMKCGAGKCGTVKIPTH